MMKPLITEKPSRKALMTGVLAVTALIAAVVADGFHEVEMDDVYKADRVTSGGPFRTVYATTNTTGEKEEFVLDNVGDSPVNVGECFEATVRGYNLTQFSDFLLAVTALPSRLSGSTEDAPKIGYSAETLEPVACPG